MNTISIYKQDDMVRSCYRATALLATCSAGIVHTLSCSHTTATGFEQLVPLWKQFLLCYNSHFDPFSHYLKMLEGQAATGNGYPMQQELFCQQAGIPMMCSPFKNIPEALLEMMETPGPGIDTYWQHWFETRHAGSYALLHDCRNYTELFVEYLKNNPL